MVVWTDTRGFIRADYQRNNLLESCLELLKSFRIFWPKADNQGQKSLLATGYSQSYKLLLLIILLTQTVLATGEQRTTGKYILTDFELTVSEQQKIKISTDELNDARADIKNSEILFVHQIGNIQSEQLEDQLILLKENNYLDQINYLYSLDLQKDDLDIQIRLVLKQYLPEIFFKYVKFKKQKNLESSAALYYAGVSPNIVYELVGKYGGNLINENKKMLKKYAETKEFPLLYMDDNIIEERDLVKIMEILNHRSYQVTENLATLKVFVSPEAELEYLPVSFDNIIKLTKEESLKIAEQLGIDIFPYALVEAKPQQVAFLQDKGFVKKIDYLVMEGLGKIKFYKNRVQLPGRVDVFVDGNQPESLIMLNELSSLQKNIFLHMQASSLSNEENIRLLCLYKYSPQKFWGYVYAKLFLEQDWQKTCETLNIDPEPIEKCVTSEEGERYLKEGLFLINELKIKNTPQILWQNQYLIGSVADLKKISSFAGEAE